MSRRAEAILDELLRQVEPPRGVVISITECPPAHSQEPNWIGEMSSPADLACLARFDNALSELRKTDAMVDWSGVEERDSRNWRRLARWFSELEGD
jgi:hypothetical protein